MKINTKQLRKILLGSFLFLGMVSCSDFLDEQDPSNLQPESFYNNGKQAEAAIAAVYADLRFLGGGAGIFSVNFQMLMAPTGTTTTLTAQNSDLNNLYSLTYDENTVHVQNYWAGLYKIISNANLVIANVPGIINMDVVQRNKIVGEAKFLRAWAYFQAVRIWGDIPIITEPQNAASEDFLPTRSPQDEVYNLIISDLTEAESAGLAWIDNSGRVSQAAVKALLSKVYLTMAGHPLNETGYYVNAAAKAKEIIDNAGPIQLFDTYGQLHDEDLNNTGEFIFSIQYNSLVAINPMIIMLPPFTPVTYRGPAGVGSSTPDNAFYNSFEAGDLRVVDQEGWFYTTYYKDGYGEQFNLGQPFIFKYFNRKANGAENVPGTTRDNLNLMLLRYAEVLLIYAEAENEIGGPNQLAYDGLKMIRDRAQLTTPDLSSFNKDSFRDAVLTERWHELCFEMKTWFDMVRLKKVYNNNTGDFDNFVGHVNTNSNQALQEKHLLFPLPRQELVNNPNLGSQNPGY